MNHTRIVPVGSVIVALDDLILLTLLGWVGLVGGVLQSKLVAVKVVIGVPDWLDGRWLLCFLLWLDWPVEQDAWSSEWSRVL